MTPDLADSLLHGIRRAWDGACLCRRRLLHTAETPAAELAPEAIRDSVGHDLDYYAWEATRIAKIASKVTAAGMGGSGMIRAVVEELDRQSPYLRTFRDSVTHIEDNRWADDVLYAYGAVRLRPGGKVEYLLDPRYQTHDRLRDVVAVVETALQELASPDDLLLRARYRWSVPEDPPAG